MKFDVLIKQGEVIDPAAALHGVRDIGIRDGRIAAVAERLVDADAKYSIDARGLLVVPGLIDFHIHVYPQHTALGLDPDVISAAGGVTTMLDVGSAGAHNFLGFRRDTIDRARSRVRALIKEADPEVVEEWKWMGTPVWSHDGNICTGESYKSVVKLTFAKGASLKDPARLFNSSLDGNVRRAIDIREGEEVDADAFKALIRAAVALNTSSAKTKRAK